MTEEEKVIHREKVRAGIAAKKERDRAEAERQAANSEAYQEQRKEKVKQRKGTNHEKAQAIVDQMLDDFGDDFDPRIRDEDPLATIEYARMYYRQSFQATRNFGHLKAAVDCATQSLPYLRPKLAQTQNTLVVENPMANLTVDAIDRLLAAAGQTPLQIEAKDAVIIQTGGEPDE